MPSGCSNPKGAKQDIKKNPPEKNKEKEKKCPLQEVKLVELVEVVTEGKGEVPVTGVADAPKGGVPVPWKSELAGLKRPTNPERQYINLPRKFRGFGHGGAPHHGRYIELRARVKSKGAASGSLAGKTVHFSCTPTYGTGRPGQIYEGGKEGFGHQKLATLRTYTNKDGWTGVVRFNLSMYGGDKFKIAAQADENGDGKPEGKKLETGNYQVWRKLFYKVACMKRYDGTNYSGRIDEGEQKKKYKDLFIELERTGNIKTASWSSVIEKGNAKTWVDNASGAAGDRTISFGLIDTLVKGDPIEFEKTYNPTNQNFTKSLRDYAFDLSAQNKWLVSAKYRDKNVTPETFHNIPNAKVKLDPDGLKHKLTIDLSSIVTLALPVNQLRLKVKLKKRKSLSGVSSGPATIVAMRWREDHYPLKSTEATLHTMLHEAGHFLGLAPKKLPDAAKSNNPNWYNNPGVGNHCKYDTNKCILYHSFRMTLDFCANCSQSLRARDLSSPKVSATSDY